jgi:vitamin B12 transporter
MTWVIGGLGVALAVMMAAGPVSAQEKTEPAPKVEELDPVVITATKTPTPVGQTGSSVTVLDEATIRRREQTDVLQILRDVPGVSLIQTGSRGTQTSLFTRGGNSDMNLILFDGMKANLGGGGFDFADTTTVGLRRVEMVRGPQSALYGADAMTSVIQFFTPRGEGPFSAWLFAGGGNYATHEERVGFSWGNKLAGVFFEFGDLGTEGNLKVNSDFRSQTYAGRVDLSPTPDLDFYVTARYVDSFLGVATENAGDRFDTLDPHQSSENERFIGTFNTRFRQTDWLEHRLKVGWSSLNNNFLDPNDGTPFDAFSPPEGTRTMSKEQRMLADYNAALSVPKFWDLTPVFVVGGSFEREWFQQRSHPVGTPGRVSESRDTVSAYTQLQLAWREYVFVTAGGRYDDADAFGEEWTPRVSVALVAPVTSTRLRGAWGTGIKAPSFFAQFGGFGIPGNPNIKAEKSESWEIGVDQPLFGKVFEVGATYFENHFRDLITFVSFTEGSTNIQAAKTSGVEFVATLRPLAGWTATGNYTFLTTEVTDDGGIGGQNTFPQGKSLLRRPTHSGSVSVAYQRDRFDISTTLFVKGSSEDRNFDAPGAPRVNLPGYQKLDLAFSWTLFRNVIGLQEINWRTRLSNVLNQQYEEVFGFSSPRISALTGFEIRY